jgi:purine-nucleoside phosphorylase
MRNMRSLPEFFRLDDYHIAPADSTRMVFHCDPDAIHADVILMPSWQPEVLAQWVERITLVGSNILYEIEYQGKLISMVRSGIGAPQAGDAVLALDCTPCERILFAGSAGGLRNDMKIGGLLMPDFSYAGDGFCRYLQDDFTKDGHFLEKVSPDATLSNELLQAALPLAQDAGVRLHHGPVFCTDSILSQFRRLDFIAGELGCSGIEMESAAVFMAAHRVGIKAAALMSISDVPVRGQSLFNGRSAEDKTYRKMTRSQVLAKTLLDCASLQR